MNKPWYIVCLFMAISLASCSGRQGKGTEVDELPPVFPDIAEVTVPGNIAPLNFMVKDTVSSVSALFESAGTAVELKGKNKIIIPAKEWNKLLKAGSDGSISIAVKVKKDGKWYRYKPFSIYVREPVDPYLVYRRIAPGYESWSEMGIYQRDLSSFNESVIIDNRLLTGNCMNCHSFNRNNPSEMVFHLRGNIGATMMVKDDLIKKLNTKTDSTISNCVYPYWHPSGNFIAFSVNKISQVFHSISGKRIEVMDSGSDIVVFDTRSDRLVTTGLIFSGSSFETFPCFTPDGKTLVFCTATKRNLPDEYSKVKYSLCSIPFDPDNGTFGGKVDTLLSSCQTGRSISFPRPSFDGRYIMFTMSDYGNFSIWHKDADLFLLDLATREYRRLDEANSAETESYHSWSSSSRWFVFSSRRTDGLYTRPYLARLDSEGRVSKPFLLPQKDPEYYVYSLFSFNVPEFVSGKVPVNGMDMIGVIGSEPKNVAFERR